MYVTDAAQAIAANIAHRYGGQELTMRWVDLLDDKPADNRTGDEIALDVIQRAGLKWG